MYKSGYFNDAVGSGCGINLIYKHKNWKKVQLHSICCLTQVLLHVTIKIVFIWYMCQSTSNVFSIQVKPDNDSYACLISRWHMMWSTCILWFSKSYFKNHQNMGLASNLTFGILIASNFSNQFQLVNPYFFLLWICGHAPLCKHSYIWDIYNNNES